MGERKHKALTLVGASSLLTIFGILCLTVFALLCLSTVRYAQQLSEHNRQAALDYYAADCAAQEILSALRGGQTVQNVVCNGDIYAYRCPISSEQMLEVEVLVRGTEYEILRWQAVSFADWQADERLPVWNGE